MRSEAKAFKWVAINIYLVIKRDTQQEMGEEGRREFWE